MFGLLKEYPNMPVVSSFQRRSKIEKKVFKYAKEFERICEGHKSWC